jgi:carbon monoxide dehydrogenase subunit G
MKVQLEKSYAMPASADVVWTLLQDIEGVATCMPGAKITERVDATHYKGTVAVKLGPASLSFRGEIEVKGIDASAKSLHLFAKGTDTTGGSAASMDLTARVEGVDAAGSNLVGTSEVSMSGKAATFGGRVMVPVADQILGQFAANFSTKVQAMQTQPAAPGAAPAAAAQAGAAGAPEPKPLNGLALMWAVFKGWLTSLFAAKKS